MIQLRTLAISAVVVGFTAAVGCGGTETQPVDQTGGAGGEGGGNTNELSGKEFYAEVVHPELQADCGFCHASGADCTPQFMADGANASYEKLKELPGIFVHPDNSNIIHHGAHTGPALTNGQEDLVRDWLSREFPEEPSGVSQIDAIDEFGDCMDYQDFLDSGLWKLAYADTADVGPCWACHQTGEAGTWLGTNQMEMFEKNSQLPYIKRLIKPRFEGTEFVGFEASNRFITKVEESISCGSKHPSGLMSASEKQSIQTFVQSTLVRYENGTCGEPIEPMGGMGGMGAGGGGN